MKTIRVLISTLMFVVWCFLGGTIAVLGARDFAMRVWSRIALWGLGIRVRVDGQKPPPGGSLLVLNHTSFFDIVVVGACAPGSFIAKGQIADWPLTGVMSKGARLIFVDRDNARRSLGVVDKVLERIKLDEMVICFAEGGIVTKGDRVATFKPMFFEAGAQAGCPVYPAVVRCVDPVGKDAYLAVDGGGLMDLYRRWIAPDRTYEVRLSFGNPVDIQEGDGRKELAAKSFAEAQRLWDEMEPAVDSSVQIGVQGE